MAFEISENMSKQGALSAWGDKVIYNMELSQEEKEFSECVARAAAGKALAQAGAARQVNHEVEEVEPLAVGPAIQVDLRQAVILGHDLGQVLLLERVLAAGVGDHRLHGNLLEALVGQE